MTDLPIGLLFCYFCCGALTFGMLLASMFFLKAYRVTKDRFFLFFVLSFLIMMIERIVWAVFGKNWFDEQQTDLRTILYAIRFLAFSIIAIGVIDKNLRFDRKGIKKTNLTVISRDKKSA